MKMRPGGRTNFHVGTLWQTESRTFGNARPVSFTRASANRCDNKLGWQFSFCAGARQAGNLPRGELICCLLNSLDMPAAI